MTAPSELPYRIAGRELVSQVDGMRVQLLTLVQGKGIPWHHHTTVTDVFVCINGTTVVETRNPNGRHELEPGQHCVVLPMTKHEVSSKTEFGCCFAIIQGVGEHDFVTSEIEIVPEHRSTNI